MFFITQQSNRPKFVWLLLLLMGFLNTALAQNKEQVIHLPKGPQTFEAIFKLVQKQAGYTFFYSNAILNDKEKIDIKSADIILTDLLNVIADAKGLVYLFSGKQIILQKKETVKQSTTVTKIIKGRVTGNANEPLPNASIHLKGTTQKVVADKTGNFILRNVLAGSKVIVSSIGYETQETAIVGNAIIIKLKSTTAQLDEVVVTALGIAREQKSLGFSTQKIEGSEVADAPTNGFINALSGKVAGLNLTKVGGPMGSSKVVLRGENVLDMGGSGALIVVDGVPINTSFTGTSHSSYLGGDSPIDFGSALTDINPDDIENINILKGPAAAALYGSRAMNGAVIITTKNGSKDKKGVGVTFTSHVAIDQINHWPDYQYEYGQGLNNAQYYSYGTSVDGVSTASTSSAWGPKFNGQTFFQYDSPKDPVTGARSERLPWKANPNNRKDFFQTGLTTTNSISVGSSSLKGDARLSYTNMRNEWIMPNTGYTRHTVAFSGTTKVTDKLTLSTKVNYTNKAADNLPSMGYNNQTIAYFLILQTPNVNLDFYQPYWLPGKEGIAQVHPFSSLVDNPYLIVNEMINASNRHNVTGNVNGVYKINKDLELMVRTSVDMGYEFRSQRRPKNTQKFQDGMYRQQTVFNSENNSDVLLKYKRKFNKDFVVTTSLGGNMRYQQRYSTDQRADRLSAPNQYNLANAFGAIKSYSDRATANKNSIYAFANLAFKDMLFADVTGRSDWSSTLPEQNNNFFYPSVSLSASLDKMLKLPAAVNSARLRFAFASVGNDASFGTYSLDKYFVAGTLEGTATNPSIIPNNNLKPERNNAFEVGTQWSFFKSRVDVDVTGYYQNSINQILSAPIDPSTGYTYQLTNVGSLVNRGLEVTLKLKPIQTRSGFTWQTDINWAMNKSVVKKLNNIGGSMILATGARGTLEAREGRPMGDLYGIGYKRSPDGQIVFDNGLATRTDSTIFLGNTAPAWRGGINNRFAYKNFSLSVLFDFRKGGVMYSLSHAALSEGGKLKESLPGRETGIVGNGVMLKDGKYVANNVLVTNVSSYYDGLYNRDVVEGNIFDASFVKLREVNLQFNFGAKWLKRKAKFIQGASIGVFGRDLFIWSDFPMFDPETATLDNNTIIPGFETGQFPSTRTMGANLKINF